MGDEAKRIGRRALNGNVLVSLSEESKTLSNGMRVQEERGKKDIASGKVAMADGSAGIPEGATVWFPMYAALPMLLGDAPLMVVKKEDIILLECAMAAEGE